jgi:hypothetical protein
VFELAVGRQAAPTSVQAMATLSSRWGGALLRVSGLATSVRWPRDIGEVTLGWQRSSDVRAGYFAHRPVDLGAGNMMHALGGGSCGSSAHTA